MLKNSSKFSYDLTLQLADSIHKQSYRVFMYRQVLLSLFQSHIKKASAISVSMLALLVISSLVLPCLAVCVCTQELKLRVQRFQDHIKPFQTHTKERTVIQSWWAVAFCGCISADCISADCTLSLLILFRPFPLSKQQKRFIKGLRQFGKNFFRIRKELLPNKETVSHLSSM